MPLRALLLLLLALAAASAPPARRSEAGDPPRFFKGNTHAHTLWSDGDAAPELAVAGYRERGWDFLALTDHNVIARGERWFPVTPDGRLTPARAAALVERFGADAVELRERPDGGRELRLATLDALRARFERPGEFLLLTGEEVTDRFEQREVHVNGLNLDAPLDPQGGASALETVLRDVAAIEAAAAPGRPTLAHVNHPNFAWSLGAAELAAVPGVAFFEVYNGHPGVHNSGDAERPSTERLWDEALFARLGAPDRGPLYGLATDDGHHYHDFAVGRSNPFRGWVMVRAAELEPAALVAALRAGDFYSSTGVVLRDFRAAPEERSLELEIEAEEGVEYTTRFIGSYASAAPADVGRVLATVRGVRATFRSDDHHLLYVRAEVRSSEPHPNPSEPGEVERAWLQPVVLRRRGG